MNILREQFRKANEGMRAPASDLNTPEKIKAHNDKLRESHEQENEDLAQGGRIFFALSYVAMVAYFVYTVSVM